MSTARKGFYYKRLKEAGVGFERHYREYTTDDLKAAHDRAVAEGLLDPPTQEEIEDMERRAHAPKERGPKPDMPVESPIEAMSRQRQELLDAEIPATGSTRETLREDDVKGITVPTTENPVAQSNRPLDDMAGTRQNTKDPDDIIRVDEQGRQWIQEEVRKPAYPKPRGRRVLSYQDPGTVTKTVQAGEYTETFEVAGDPRNSIPSQVKITLPSFQVGMYRDRRFPFKVITYNGIEGFDRKEVEEFYGGAELVPTEAKRMYVENVLCYDMRSVIRAIQNEYRQQQLAGRVQ